MILTPPSPEFYKSLEKLKGEGYRHMTENDYKKYPEYALFGAVCVVINDEGKAKSVDIQSGEILDFNPRANPPLSKPKASGPKF